MKRIFAVALWLFVCVLPASATTYSSVVNLGTLGGATSYAVAVNASGQVVGVSDTPGNTYVHAFSWTQASGMVDLGTLPGGHYSWATAVNDNGQVVGRSTVANETRQHTFLWTQAGGMVDLGTLGGTFSYPVAISDSGQVVGVSALPGNTVLHAFSWTQAGGMVDLVALVSAGNSSEATGVSYSGHIVGASAVTSDPEGDWHAFLWTEAGGMVDLGTLGGSNSRAAAVNAGGQIVGTASLPGNTTQHAFFWTETGGMQDLGTNGGQYSYATVINAHGQVAGYSSNAAGAYSGFSWTQADGRVDIGRLAGNTTLARAVNGKGLVAGDGGSGPSGYHAFAWTAGGGLKDLGTLGGAFSHASGVNDAGQVVGDSDLTFGTSRHAALWNVVELDAITVVPGSGTAPRQVFSLLYRDSRGASDLQSVRVRFALTNVSAGSCTARYNPATDAVELMNDDGAGWTGGVLGGAPISNSQCTLNLATSSADESGDDLTLALDVTFTPTFVGVKNIYMSAISGSVEGANTGWRQRGTWTVVPPDLNAVSVTPSDGIGVAQTFSATFSDDAGADDVKLVAVRFGAANVAAGVCTVQYNATTGMARIQSDAGTPGPWTAFGSGTLANSQCTLDLALSSADASGNNLTLQLHLAFAPAFGGAKTIYLRANSDLGPTTGWVTRGAWTVGGEMDAISIAPSNATGVTELFTAIFSDSLGAAADLTQASVRVGATNVAAGVCTVQYNAMTGQVRLHDDAGIAGPWTTFGSGTLVNTQCALDLAQSNAVAAGSVLTLNLRLTFKAAFLGARNIHMRANSRYGSTSGWQPRGTYTVGAAVTAGAVTPNSGTGMSPSFVLDYTNSAGVEADLKVARVRFRPPSGSGPQCVIDYDAMSNKVRIQQDSGLWSSFVPFGGPLPALANSRCTLDLTQGGAVRTGTSLSLTLRLTFDISFVGAKQIDMRANSNVGPTTGWVNRGTWMVLPPTTTIVPSSSTAVIDTLLIQLSNPATCCSNPMSLDNIVVFD